MNRVVGSAVITSFFLIIFRSALEVHLTHMLILPEVSLIILLYVSLFNGSLVGIWTGFILGFLVDFLSFSPFGLHAFIFTIIGWTIGKLYKKYNIDRIIFPILITFLAMVIKIFLPFVLRFFFGSEIRVISAHDFSLWIEIAVTILTTPVFFFIMKLLPQFFLVDKDYKK